MERLIEWVRSVPDHEVCVFLYGTYYRLSKNDPDGVGGLEIEAIGVGIRERVHSKLELAEFVRRFGFMSPTHSDTVIFDFENAVWRYVRSWY